MSTQRGSVQAETGISREHIIRGAEVVELETFALADCLRELQSHLQEIAPELNPDVGSWSGDGLCLLVAPLEQYKEILGELGRFGYPSNYAAAARKAHLLEAEERHGEALEPARDRLMLVQ